MPKAKEEKTKLMNSICLRIENGSSLRSSLREEGISNQYFYEMIDECEEFAKQYARACVERAEAIVDEIIEISDESNADAYLDDEGNTVIDGSAIQRSKLKVDSRKWLVGKLNPKKYGEKIELEQSGEITINFHE